MGHSTVRFTVFTPYGSLEQTVIAPANPRYQTATEDFSAHLTFWTSREMVIRAKFPE